MVLLYPLLPTGGAPNWGLSRFSKQFRKRNSRKLAASFGKWHHALVVERMPPLSL